MKQLKNFRLLLTLAVALLIASTTVAFLSSSHSKISKENIAEAQVMICISKTAYAYHSHECRGLARCTHKIETVSISEAKKAGYVPCKICYK